MIGIKMNTFICSFMPNKICKYQNITFVFGLRQISSKYDKHISQCVINVLWNISKMTVEVVLRAQK